MLSKIQMLNSSLRPLLIEATRGLTISALKIEMKIPGNHSILSIVSPFLNQTRNTTSFFCRNSAEQLWKGVTSVSNAGRKRGRGKGTGRKTAKNLNRGQIIGVGKVNIRFPGLNAPIIQGKELLQQVSLPPDEEREKKLLRLRDSMATFKPLKLSPLERGWSGAKMHGRSIGPPDPIGDVTFEGFDTKILAMKTVAHMSANFGKVRQFSVFSFTGNGNGLGGFAEAKSAEGKAALRKSKNRAAQKLLYFERFNDHTILHDFHCRFGQTQLFVYKKPPGYGLVCHRALREICKLIGIKDIYAKREGARNLQHTVKAFILGLLRQKKYNEVVADKGLFLVEQRKEEFLFPRVIAAPPKLRTENEIPSDEVLDFTQVMMDGKIALRRKKKEIFYTRLPSWTNHLLKTEWRRGHQEINVHMAAEYGHGKSQLTSIYPESDRHYAKQLMRKKKAEAAAQEEAES